MLTSRIVSVVPEQQLHGLSVVEILGLDQQCVPLGSSAYSPTNGTLSACQFKVRKNIEIFLHTLIPNHSIEVRH